MKASPQIKTNKPAEKETEEQIRVKPYREIIEMANELRYGTEFDNDNNLLIRYHFLGEGTILCDRINVLMADKYPNKEFHLSILHGRYIVKVKIY